MLSGSFFTCSEQFLRASCVIVSSENPIFTLLKTSLEYPPSKLSLSHKPSCSSPKFPVPSNLASLKNRRLLPFRNHNRYKSYKEKTDITSFGCLGVTYSGGRRMIILRNPSFVMLTIKANSEGLNHISQQLKKPLNEVPMPLDHGLHVSEGLNHIVQQLKKPLNEVLMPLDHGLHILVELTHHGWRLLESETFSIEIKNMPVEQKTSQIDNITQKHNIFLWIVSEEKAPIEKLGIFV